MVMIRFVIWLVTTLRMVCLRAGGCGWACPGRCDGTGATFTGELFLVTVLLSLSALFNALFIRHE